MRGIPGREGLEQTAQPQFKVGDRVEIVGPSNIGDFRNQYGNIGTILRIDKPLWSPYWIKYEKEPSVILWHTEDTIKLLPQLMICPKAEMCPVEHCYHCDKKPHKHNPERCSVRSVNCPACIPYVEQPDEQMVDILPLINTLQRESGVLAPVYLQPRRVQQRTLRAILAPYMEGSDE